LGLTTKEKKMIKEILEGICAVILFTGLPLIAILQSRNLFPGLEGPAEFFVYFIVLVAILIILILAIRALDRRTTNKNSAP